LSGPFRKLRKAVVVCGPTAAGKSALADALAADASEAFEGWVTTVLVDSMQVYREIPAITNQARSRPAELAGVVSVADEWNVALHRDAALEVAAGVPEELPLVFDAGTGMYLNAIVTELPLAPRVPEEVRREAARLAEAGAGDEFLLAERRSDRGELSNPRRRARGVELGMVGVGARGSVWEAPLRFDAAFVYVRPPRDVLDRNIAARSARIARDALAEAERLASAMEDGTLRPNRSVLDAVGVREMLLLARGELDEGAAAEEIARRTRRLARRQLRWFDKLARTLRGAPERVLVLDEPGPEAARRAAQWVRGKIAPR